MKTIHRKQLSDLQTPVGIYLKVRDLYPQSALLESSDYHSTDNAFSYIGVEPIARFTVEGDTVSTLHPDGRIDARQVGDLPGQLDAFVRSFEIEGACGPGNGLFGYTAYDAARYFEGLSLRTPDAALAGIPELNYLLYRFVIAIDPLRNELTVTENLVAGDSSRMDELLAVIDSRNFPTYGFETAGETVSPLTDGQFRAMIVRGIDHCVSGEVSQIVLARRFEKPYRGDDFEVYRALRSVNPSPYLFYFDFGSYRIFGSSPETHLRIKGDMATIDPIAGTFRRTGDDERDRELARQLLADPKENVEHEMLVELAWKDLAKHATDIRVDFHRQVQFYSHVIHLVSRVSGRIAPEANRIAVFADTFPAGTVSGAPKRRALELIDAIEQTARGVYGGCIGHIGFDGNLNQAITIRTFVSRNNTLYFQAGAGVVAQSDPDKEVQEINNKLAALNHAIEIADRK